MWKRKGRISLLATVALLFLAVAPAAASTEEEVARRIICQCGCNKVLAICEMEGWAIPAKEIIAQKAARGLTADEIVRYFVAQYGEKILAAPPKRGFFLAAWLTPLASLLLGGSLLVILLRRWVRQEGVRDRTAASLPPSQEQQKLLARFEAEVREEA